MIKNSISRNSSADEWQKSDCLWLIKKKPQSVYTTLINWLKDVKKGAGSMQLYSIFFYCHRFLYLRSDI